MIRLIVLAALAFGLVANAQNISAPAKVTAPTAKDEKPIPVISDAQIAKYWKAQAENMQAQQVAQKAQTALQDAISEMQKTCGDGAVLTGDPATNNPKCVAKPEEPKK